MKRCAICDYTIDEGSVYADVQPGAFKLHDHNGEFLCDECYDEYENNLADITPDEEEG